MSSLIFLFDNTSCEHKPTIVSNCHGLGNLSTGNELEVVIRAKDPSSVFIAETWADKARLKVLKNTLLFDEMFVVPRINRGGGLVLFWKKIGRAHV